jgi:hypothetical protein
MDQPLGHFSAGRKPWAPPKQALAPEKSAALRDRLLGELAALATLEQATTWAQMAKSGKNTLTAADSGTVEDICNTVGWTGRRRYDRDHVPVNSAAPSAKSGPHGPPGPSGCWACSCSQLAAPILPIRVKEVVSKAVRRPRAAMGCSTSPRPLALYVG